MAGGNIFWKERAIVTLTSSGASLTNNSGAAVGTNLDVRAAGNAAGDKSAIFELTCQWGTVTGIAAGTKIADLYLVPLMDATNLSNQIDLSSGASYIPFSCRVGGFFAAKIPTASTDTKFVTNALDSIPLLPLLYTAHLINTSGQTWSANWTLKSITAQDQYS
jgi:hypothetical protein